MIKNDFNQPKGSTIGVLKDGRTIQEAIDDLYVFKDSQGFINVDVQTGATLEEKLRNSFTIANTLLVGVRLTAGKVYPLTGTTPLEVNLAKFSLFTSGGRATIDASEFTGPTALWIHATGSYPTPMYRNTTNYMESIELVGGLKAGVDGWTWGNRGMTTGTEYNGQCIIRGCSVYKFDNCIKCTDSSWRYKVSDCMISTGITSVFNAPAGLIDSGESITFSDTQFSDSNGAKFIIACANFSVGMSGTSVLNTPVVISGNGASLLIDGMGNNENPGKSSWMRYVEVTGIGARFILQSSTLVCNGPSSQTRPLVLVGAKARAIFIAVKFPGNLYMFHVNNPEKVRTFCEGEGIVKTIACTYDIESGAGNIPVHRSLNRFYNNGFEQDLAGWALNVGGDPAQTATIVTDDTNSGGKAVKVASLDGKSVFLTQNVRVSSGEEFASFVAYKVNKAASGSTPGNLTVAFKSENGTTIGAGSTSNFSNTVGAWQQGGLFCRGVAPVGAVSAEISLRVRDGAEVILDDVIVNFL